MTQSSTLQTAERDKGMDMFGTLRRKMRRIFKVYNAYHLELLVIEQVLRLASHERGL